LFLPFTALGFEKSGACAVLIEGAILISLCKNCQEVFTRMTMESQTFVSALPIADFQA